MRWYDTPPKSAKISTFQTPKHETRFTCRTEKDPRLRVLRMYTLTYLSAPPPGRQSLMRKSLSQNH